MDFKNLLAFDLNETKTQLINKGYHIEEVEYLNEPPGTPRVVRIKTEQGETKKIKILVTYHCDDLSLNT